MIKLAVYTDIHFSFNKGAFNYTNGSSSTKLKSIELFFDKLYDWCLTNRPNAIINCGDTVTDIGIIDSPTINSINRCFSKISRLAIPHYVLLGNHDLYNDNHTDPIISFLSEFDNTYIIDRPTSSNLQIANIDNFAFFIPYYKPNVLLQKFEDHYNSIKQSKLCFLHADVLHPKGTRQGLDLNYLSTNFPNTTFINGHLHIPFSQLNFFNIGSTLTHNHTEWSDNRGLNIIQLSSLSSAPIITVDKSFNTFDIKEISIESIDQFLQLNLPYNLFLKINLLKPADLEKLESILAFYRGYRLEKRYYQDSDINIEIALESNTDPYSILLEYLKHKEDEIAKLETKVTPQFLLDLCKSL